MSDRFVPLDDDEVLYVDVGRILMSNPTFKVGEFLDALAQAVSDREVDWSEDHEGWFSHGTECEALRLSSSGWQRGRVRIRLEFAPAKSQEQLPERSSWNGGGRERLLFRARTVTEDEFEDFEDSL
jgi:hypothetical protein